MALTFSKVPGSVMLPFNIGYQLKNSSGKMAGFMFQIQAVASSGHHQPLDSLRWSDEAWHKPEITSVARHD